MPNFKENFPQKKLENREKIKINSSKHGLKIRYSIPDTSLNCCQKRNPTFCPFAACCQPNPSARHPTVVALLTGRNIAHWLRHFYYSSSRTKCLWKELWNWGRPWESWGASAKMTSRAGRELNLKAAKNGRIKGFTKLCISRMAQPIRATVKMMYNAQENHTVRRFLRALAGRRIRRMGQGH